MRLKTFRQSGVAEGMDGRIGRLEKRPGLIGSDVQRRDVDRLLRGRGSYVDDIKLARMVHVHFLRSPYAHARIVSIQTEEAKKAPGVVRIVTGNELAEVITPWVGVLGHMASMKSAEQSALAIDKVCWQGEPVAAIVAESRAQAEDAAELIEVDYDPLPVVADKANALDADSPVIHEQLGDNLCYERKENVGDVDKAFQEAHAVVEEVFDIGRHTAVTLEPRSILADFNPGDRKLTVHLSSQVPHMMQYLFAKHLGLPEADVRVRVPDMGGGFGLKIHIYGDEMATAALSMMLERPVKHIADRTESFVSDTHARDHQVRARLAVDADGRFMAWEVDDLCGAGAYSVYPRGSVNESKQVLNLTGGPYATENYRGRARVVFQNKPMLGQYRAVGHPIVCSVTEGMVDRAAHALGLDPADIRRRNFIPEDAYPYKRPAGPVLERLSQHASLEKLLSMMDYPSLRNEQSRLREKNVYRGIGLASYIEMSNPSSATYGVGGAPITSQDGCVVRLNAQGSVTCAVGVTEIGQGARTMIGQIVATVLGVGMEDVTVLLGDTEVTPYGGGNWGSRGAGISGEAAYLAAGSLRENLLSAAGVLLQCDPAKLRLEGKAVVDEDSGEARMTIAELAYTVYFRSDLFPKSFQPELVASRHYAQKALDGVATNGIQGSYLEVDIDTGFVSLLGHWLVHDCGTVINPAIVNEQLRGAVVQGLGGALGEECLYSSEGQLMNGTLAEYLVPMAAEMPDIEIALISTPTETSSLGAKGAAEAGAAGAPAATMNAINDAIQPLGGRVAAQPFTPERILRALNKIGG
jgi:carbon-monoxide dehydrogenase large subunit